MHVIGDAVDRQFVEFAVGVLDSYNGGIWVWVCVYGCVCVRVGEHQDHLGICACVRVGTCVCLGVCACADFGVRAGIWAVCVCVWGGGGGGWGAGGGGGGKKKK